jgi:hypothetical protein
VSDETETLVETGEVTAADEPTGVASVDGAQTRLRDIETTPVEAHVEIFDDVQRQLHDALAELDDGQ